ncbi:protein of unknown function [Petrocella atlantisensis]|uniref:Uncharacterized protein n=1 Tax=Petrocella atlantisensis TaxID=2173034 RepID=A0A3P7NWX6_9FIRM|nr:protein of unknown function [Petrocella atlantisensis]
MAARFKKQRTLEATLENSYKRYPERPGAKLEVHSFISCLDP